MISLLLQFATASATIPFAWDVREGTRHRWVMESEIALPNHVWLYADANVDVRARSLRTQMVLDCQVRNGEGQLDCTVEDASFAGQTYPSEQGLLQPVLDEMDAKLTGARIRFTLRQDGRLGNTKVNLNKLRASTNRRTRHMAEVVRTLVQRTLSPFDVLIPHQGLEEGGWPQRQATSLRLLTLQGTAGGGRLVHHASVWGEHKVLVATVGRATLVDGATIDRSREMFATRVTGHTLYDTKLGILTEARWEIVGEPTASAGLNIGIHASRIQIRVLTQDENVRLQPTVEWATGRRG